MHPYELIPMNIAGFALAAWLIGFHLWMLLKEKESIAFMKRLPRNYAWGRVLMIIGMTWFWLLVLPNTGEGKSLSPISMDLGEFNKAKKFLLILVPVAAYLMVTKVREFLAVRAIGLLCLMVAAPLLYASYQRWPSGRTLMPLYAYLMLTAGMFFVGMPFLMRDAVKWASDKPKRWKLGAVGGLVYGIAVLVCSIAFWGGVK